MLNVQFYLPSSREQWLVRQYETIKSKSTRLLTDRFIPRPDVALVFHFASIPQMMAPHPVPLKPVFIAPIALQANRLQAQGELDTFVVMCKASVLSRILELDFKPGPNIILDLPSNRFLTLWQDLEQCKSDKQRIECFSHSIQSYVPQGYLPDCIDVCYDRILLNSIEVSLPELARTCFRSMRSLQRNFKKRVGVSLKTLVRIARVNHIFEHMIQEKSFKSQNLLFKGNYYDQAHFIKEFKAFTGQTPKQFFLQHSELCQTLSGKPNVPASKPKGAGLTD